MQNKKYLPRIFWVVCSSYWICLSSSTHISSSAKKWDHQRTREGSPTLLSNLWSLQLLTVPGISNIARTTVNTLNHQKNHSPPPPSYGLAPMPSMLSQFLLSLLPPPYFWVEHAHLKLYLVEKKSLVQSVPLSPCDLWVLNSILPVDFLYPFYHSFLLPLLCFVLLCASKKVILVGWNEMKWNLLN